MTEKLYAPREPGTLGSILRAASKTVSEWPAWMRRPEVRAPEESKRDYAVDDEDASPFDPDADGDKFTREVLRRG